MTYKSSPYQCLASGHIRVLEFTDTASTTDNYLTCQMKTIKLQNVQRLEQPYSALSYVWGDPDDTTAIMCNKITRNITCNLKDALLAIWKVHPSKLIWADALCIDQSNLRERNHQVSMMGDIFGLADDVFVYLGPTLNGQNRFWTLLQNYSLTAQFACGDDEIVANGSLGEENQNVGAGIEDLVSRPWFYRAWTYQEVRLAATAVVFCGSSFMPWNAFVNAIQAFNKEGAYSAQYFAAFMRSYSAFRAFLAKQMLLFETSSALKNDNGTSDHKIDTFNSVQKAPLMDLLIDTWPRAAGDPRDKVYAIVSSRLTSTAYTELLPDYHLDLKKTYIRVIRAYINNANNLEFLKYAVGTCEETYWPGRYSPRGDIWKIASKDDKAKPVKLPNLDREPFSSLPSSGRAYYDPEFGTIGYGTSQTSLDNSQDPSRTSPWLNKETDGFPTWICDWRDEGIQNTAELRSVYNNLTSNAMFTPDLMPQSVQDFSNRLVLRGYALARLLSAKSTVHRGNPQTDATLKAMGTKMKSGYKSLITFQRLPECALHRAMDNTSKSNTSTASMSFRIKDIETSKRTPRSSMPILLLQAMLYDQLQGHYTTDVPGTDSAVDSQTLYIAEPDPMKAYCLHETYPRSPMAELDWLVLLDGLNLPVLLRPYLRARESSIEQLRSEIGFQFVSVLPLTILEERERWEEAPCAYGEFTLL